MLTWYSYPVMQLRFSAHLVIYLVSNVLFFLLNAVPVQFDLDRPGVPLWFLYPLVGWGVLLVAHGLLVVLRPAQPAQPRAPAAPRPQVDPGAGGRAGELLASCRMQAGQVLSALGAVSAVPVEFEELLREAVEQAERLAEILAGLYAAGQDIERVDLLEAALGELELALKILRLETGALTPGQDADMELLDGPLTQLRDGTEAAAALQGIET